jgi:hypothetical protein
MLLHMHSDFSEILNKEFFERVYIELGDVLIMALMRTAPDGLAA